MYHSGYPPFGATPPQAGGPSVGGHFGTPMGYPGLPQQNGYSSPPQPQQHFQQPFPNNGMPSTSVDPNAFAHMFKSHLASLTFNSKPIITNLTVLAHENVAHMARVVAQCLDEHILAAPPAYRLPALYALDSISKNVGAPYTDLWSQRIPVIFMETYRIVDHAVKGRMEELLNTWRHSGPNQSPLFGNGAQESIERSIWGSAGPQVGASRPQQHPRNQNGINSPLPLQSSMGSGSTTPSNNNVNTMLSRFDRLIAMSAHDQQHAPHLFDATRSEALTKLRSIVASAALSPAELGQIALQLDSLESEMTSRSSSQIRSPQHANAYRSTPPHATGTRSPLYNGANSATAIPPSLAGALANLGKLTGNSTPPVHRATPPPPMLGGQQARPTAALDLVASLRQAGLLPGASATPPPSVVTNQDAEYCQMIRGMDIKLTTLDLQREIPLGSLEAITLKELPLQCRQCANRYPGGAKGQASLDKHLDWHFRQNRRAKDSAIRGQSRSWFSKLDQWIRGGHDDTIPRTAGEAEQTTGAAALTPAQEAELKAVVKKFVVAPEDDPDAATRPCPICKELFKSEWSEEEEEFIWKNCIKVDSIYYHASCHYSAKTLSNARSTHVSSGGVRGSRDGTPQPVLSADEAAVSPIKQEEEEGEGSSAAAAAADKVTIGIKRKSSPAVASENDVEGSSSGGGSASEEGTPAKRVAIA